MRKHLKSLFVVLLVLFVIVHKLSAQFIVAGKIKIENGKLDGTRIIVTKNGVEERTVSAKTGRFVFDLEYNSDYIFTYQKRGYVTKSISINTTVTELRAKDGFDPFEYKVSLFPEEKGKEAFVFDQPVAHIRFDKELDEFDYDTDYAKSVKEAQEKAEEEMADRETELEKQRQASSLASKEEAKEAPQRKAPARKPAERTRKREVEQYTARAAPRAAQPQPTAAREEEIATPRTDAFKQQWVSNLAKQYPDLRKEEYFEEDRRKITEVVVNLNGDVSRYRKVVQPWGVTYYFKNDVSISAGQFREATSRNP